MRDVCARSGPNGTSHLAANLILPPRARRNESNPGVDRGATFECFAAMNRELSIVLALDMQSSEGPRSPSPAGARAGSPSTSRETTKGIETESAAPLGLSSDIFSRAQDIPDPTPRYGSQPTSPSTRRIIVTSSTDDLCSLDEQPHGLTLGVSCSDSRASVIPRRGSKQALRAGGSPLVSSWQPIVETDDEDNVTEATCRSDRGTLVDTAVPIS